MNWLVNLSKCQNLLDFFDFVKHLETFDKVKKSYASKVTCMFHIFIRYIRSILGANFSF